MKWMTLSAPNWCGYCSERLPADQLEPCVTCRINHERAMARMKEAESMTIDNSKWCPKCGKGMPRNAEVLVELCGKCKPPVNAGMPTGIPFDWTVDHTPEEYDREAARIFAVRLANHIDNGILEDLLMEMVEGRGFVPLTKEALETSDRKIARWQAEFGAVVDAAIGDGLNIGSTLVADETKGKHMDKHFKDWSNVLAGDYSKRTWGDPDMDKIAELIPTLTEEEMTKIIRNRSTSRVPVNPIPVGSCQHIGHSNTTGYILLGKCEEMFCARCSTHWLRSL